MLTILCARTDSIYKKLGGCDVFDRHRDARTFVGDGPVIAHPPCRGWGRFAWRSLHGPDELDLGRFCVLAVRRNGGVLEHPADSGLWADCKLPRPGDGYDRYGGWTLAVDQKWFGHPAQKRTWLYVVGVLPTAIPPLQFSLHPASTTVERQSRAARERTPPDLAEWLLQLAGKVSCHGEAVD